MQWLIDIIKEWVKLYFKGMIVGWSGTLGEIPEGWHLCDGGAGTPDFRDKFIYGSSPTVPTGNTGGTVEHSHDFTTDGHIHELLSGLGIQEDTGLQPYTDARVDTGTTDPADHLPPFYALAFIMKL